MLITQESSVFDTTLFLTSQSAACMLGMFSLDKIMPQDVSFWIVSAKRDLVHIIKFVIKMPYV